MVTKIMCKSKNKKKFKSRKKKTMKKKINDRNTKLRSMRVGGGINEYLAEKLARKFAREAMKNPENAAKRLARYGGVNTSRIDPNKLASGAAGSSGAAGVAGVDPKLGANPNVAEIIKHFEEQQEIKNKQSQGFTSYKPPSPLVSKILQTSTAQGFLKKGLDFASSKAGEDLANKWGIDSKAYKEGLGDAQKNLQPFLKQKLNSSEPSPQSQPKSSWFGRNKQPAASFDPTKATASFGDASAKVTASSSGNFKASGTAKLDGLPPVKGSISASPSGVYGKGKIGGVPGKFSFNPNKGTGSASFKVGKLPKFKM